VPRRVLEGEICANVMFLEGKAELTMLPSFQMMGVLDCAQVVPVPAIAWEWALVLGLMMLVIASRAIGSPGIISERDVGHG
jgi:hypothetical protein